MCFSHLQEEARKSARRKTFVLDSFRPTEGALRIHIPAQEEVGASHGSLLSNPPVVLSSAHLCLVRKGEGDRAEDGVFLNALISVTVWAASSLMWNRHLGSVAHAVKKGCDVLMEKQHPPGDLQITGGYICLCAPLSCQEALQHLQALCCFQQTRSLWSTAWWWWWSSFQLLLIFF